MENITPPGSEINSNSKCQVISEPKCGRPAQAEWQLSPDCHVMICLTHFRHFTIGEFGQRNIPPWSREQALHTLINQDGFDPETAAKRVNKHVGVDGGL
jgi:hypothetical protein